MSANDGYIMLSHTSPLRASMVKQLTNLGWVGPETSRFEPNIKIIFLIEKLDIFLVFYLSSFWSFRPVAFNRF